MRIYARKEERVGISRRTNALEYIKSFTKEQVDTWTNAATKKRWKISIAEARKCLPKLSAVSNK